MGGTDNKNTKRSNWHDYHERCIYLVTVTVDGRQPVLGHVTGTVEQAQITLSEAGRAVWREIDALPHRYPQVRVLQHQIMPDHVHLVLYVQERLPEGLALGNIAAAWKAACSKASAPLRGLKAAPPDNPCGTTDEDGLSGEATFRSPKVSPLFAKGYNDSILRGKGQLEHIMAYVRDNPRRLLIKQQHHSLFHIHRGITVAGMPFDCIGNLGLLQQPLVAVHCRRRWSEEEREDYTSKCIKAAQQGASLAGAFISPAERNILHQANELHLPIIHLVENGFGDLYKPVGQDFYSCAEGRLLMLAPWPYHSDTRPITRQQCMQLNAMAESIAGQN